MQITGIFTNLSNDTATEAYRARTDRDACLIPDGRVAHSQECRRERGTKPGLLYHQVRGMAHSNQLREFVLSDKGIELLDLYKGTQGVLFGSARMAQESREKATGSGGTRKIERKQRETRQQEGR